MKTVCKKLLCLMLVAMMLVSAVPFAFAAAGDPCKITLSPYSGNQDLSANKVTLMVEEGYTITEKDVKGWATDAWSELGYEFKSALLGADGTIAMPDTTIPVEVNVGNPSGSTPSNPAPSNPTPSNPTPSNPNSSESNYGTLTVYVLQYDAHNNAKDVGTVKFSGESSYTIGKALAEECFEEVGIVNYEEYKWQGQSGTLDMTNGKNYEANLLVDPVYTPGNRKIVTLTINHNRGNGNDDRQTVETLAGTKILDVLSFAEQKDYFDKPSRKGYRLAGYSFDVNCSKDINRDDVINKDMTIYCEWERDYFAEANKYDVTLRVYTNGETRYVDKVLNLEDYAGDGKITRSEVEKLLNKKYSAKSGYYLSFYGLFTAETWDDGDYDPDDAVSTIKVNDYGKTVIYVMVKNVKKAVADSSNPKTGDNIMIAVGTLTLSAAALISIIELKKRKMI